MHTFTIASAAFIALAAANPVARENLLCATPESNCYIKVDENGAKSYHFKPGMEPGSEDHTRRFAKRQDEVKTELGVSEKKIDYGCDANVAEFFSQGLGDVCQLAGACDEGKVFSRTEKRPLPYGSVDPVYEDIILELRGEGAFASDLRQPLIDALVAGPSTPDAVEGYDLVVPDETTGDGSGVAPGECRSNKYATFVQATRSVGTDLQGFMKVSIVNTWEEKQEDWCLATGILAAFAGAVTGIGGGILGAISAVMCSETVFPS